jgi:hypothetical protein
MVAALGAPSVPAHADLTDCGQLVSVGPGTSCEFGIAVKNAVMAGAGANGSAFAVTSPVTGQTYTMSCMAAHGLACTGGNGAYVFIH